MSSKTNKQTERPTTNQLGKKGYSVCLCSSFCWLVGWVVWKGNGLWPTDKTMTCLWYILLTHLALLRAHSCMTAIWYPSITTPLFTTLKQLEGSSARRENLFVSHTTNSCELWWKKCMHVYTLILFILVDCCLATKLNTTQCMNGGDNEWCSTAHTIKS